MQTEKIIKECFVVSVLVRVKAASLFFLKKDEQQHFAGTAE